MSIAAIIIALIILAAILGPSEIDRDYEIRDRTGRRPWGKDGD